MLEHLLWGEDICIDQQISVLAGMRQPAELFCIFLLRPVQIPAEDRLRVRDFQINEQVWIREALPHIRNVGMFLGDVLPYDPMLAKIGDEGGLSCTARADNADLTDIRLSHTRLILLHQDADLFWTAKHGEDIPIRKAALGSGVEIRLSSSAKHNYADFKLLFHLADAQP